MGMNPKKLVKNVPGPKQQWKAPVEQWMRDMYVKRTSHGVERRVPDHADRIAGRTADGRVAVSYFRIAGPDRWGSVDKESHGVVPITVS
jgi:hypothetical protein